MQVLNASINGAKPQQPSVTVHHPDDIESFGSVATIQGWLVGQLAERLGLEALEIDVEEDFANYGLNSIEAINLSGDLETILGRRLPPTLLWDYPNICTLAKYLADHNTLDITQYQKRDFPRRCGTSFTSFRSIIGCGCRYVIKYFIIRTGKNQ
jgi:Acyl carrier protein